MKLNSYSFPKAFFVPEGQETRLCSFLEQDVNYTELTVPEGICQIDSDAFSHFPHLTVLRLPASVVELGEGLFRTQTKPLQLFYAGTSQDFIALAAPSVTEEYVSGPYDHYPYYSDAGASTRTAIHAFDTDCAHIEVICEADGVHLYYGKDNKEPDAPLPLSHESYLMRREQERQNWLGWAEKLLRFLEQAEFVSVSFMESTQVDTAPCEGTFALIDGKLCLAVYAYNSLYRAAEREHPIALCAVTGDAWIRVSASVSSLEDEDDLIAAMRERFPTLSKNGYDYVSLDSFEVTLHDRNNRVLPWRTYP